MTTIDKVDTAQGDGRVSAFYTWDEPLSASGELLRGEPLPAELGLSAAGEQRRILYASTDGVDGEDLVAVSGAVFFPAGEPPEDGWPLLAWAHGTVGIADICAPSWNARSYRDAAYLNAWLDAGFAIVATDYQGLGTPGPHPYLNVRPEAYSVLDGIRAVQRAWLSLSGQVLLVGQSQGGGAVFGAAGFAPDYAPELDIRGTIATGTPYMAPEALVAAPPVDPDAVRPQFAYLLLLVLMAQQFDPLLDPAGIFSPRVLPLVEAARSACMATLEKDIQFAGITQRNAYAGDPAAMLEKALGPVMPRLMFPTLTLPTPVLLGIGGDDGDVPAAGQRVLAAHARTAGTLVEEHLYEGLDHAQAVNASLAEALVFARKMLARGTVTPGRTPAQA